MTFGQKIPISFDYKGKHYDGTLEEVHGAGAKVWHLTIDGYCCGQLMHIDKFVFHSNIGKFKELADLFGNHIMLWYE